MRIALFTETYLPYINGVVTHVKILKEGLEKLGHEVLVVTADPNTKIYYIKDHVLHCPGKSFKRFYDYGLASPSSTKRLKYLEQFNPDIIHIHNEFGIGLSGVAIAKKLKKPLVYTLHTMYDEYLYYITPRPFLPMAKRSIRHYAKYLAKHASALTGPSQKVQQFFDEAGVERDVSVVPNPVELDIFLPENIDEAKKQEFRTRYRISEDEMLVCFCGRLGREKSVDVLLDYWAKTIKPEDKCKLMIIGDGPVTDELKEQAQALGIADMVIFTGKVMHDDMPPYYACSDLYITASLSDTNSISMLEAMATGLPVLQRFDRLNAGQVRNGVNGFIFYDEQDMYHEIINYKNKPQEEKNALRYAVRDSVKQAGAEDLANYLLTIYKDIEFPEKPKRKWSRSH